jgi:5-methylcytosine-specific restriction enzyme subunit McrC
VKPARTLTLTEYETATFPAAALPIPVGEKLYEQYERQQRVVQVAFPGYKTGGQWQLTPQGWVGYIPLMPDLHLALQPRVPLSNLFHMLAYAHQLRRFHLLPDLTQCDTLPGFYDCLAEELARRILHRARQGLFREYRLRAERLPYVRGRLELDLNAPPGTRPDILCQYEEQTIDNLDNQLLLWTLHVVDRCGLCRQETGRLVRRAMNVLRSSVQLISFTPAAGRERNYTRLNADYAPLHTLCTLLLTHSAPAMGAGTKPTPVFLVHMATLYEQFVAAWLAEHLPAPWQLEAQVQISLGDNQDLQLAADMVLHDGEYRPVAILDTKYKTPNRVDPADFNQVVTYAQAKQCPYAFLVYPQPLARPVDIHLPNLHIRSLAFPLAGDLEANGKAFLDLLLSEFAPLSGIINDI